MTAVYNVDNTDDAYGDRVYLVTINHPVYEQLSL